MIVEGSRINYYEILELGTSAAQHEITKAYDRARRTYSGDNPAIYTIFSEKEARDLLKLIEEAYSVLGNKTLRTIYDQRLLGKSSEGLDLSYDSILTASRQNFPEPKAKFDKVSYRIDEGLEAEIQTRTEWMGSDLKKIREYKNLSIEKMSEKTKINVFYLAAVEADDRMKLPAPVFVRGYVIQIAKALGLNEKTVADSYMKAFKANAG
ncbi:MAG: helix-turn-helix domain-containing protein [Bdellovibrionaceae bacterium]|nr:helix-turn-helix domain-containing protein [Pseudobdellovibrionaceae bacterium]